MKAKTTSVLSSTNTRIASTLAAGMAVGAIATDAHAAVVYSGLQNINIGLGFSQSIDLDSSSTGDIKLENYVFSGGNYEGALVSFSPGKIVGFSASAYGYVTALSSGSLINSSNVGPSFVGLLAYGANNPSAQFNNVSDAFIGLSFPNAGNTYYGWVRVTINNAAGTFVVKDWAYDSTPGTGIAAGAGIVAVPEPSSLGWLTAGSVAGIAAMRARRRSREAKA